MTGNPHHEDRKRGRQLAKELDQFIERESATPEQAEVTLLAAFEFFDERTRTMRGVSPWPTGAGPVDVKPHSDN